MSEPDPHGATLGDRASSPPTAHEPGALSGEASVETLAPGTVVGRFIVHRALGAGGTGVVYAAHDPELDRTIALKILRREIAEQPDAHARFLREAQALARLSHPGVIAVYDVGAAAGRTFIAMEYIHGQTFASWVAAADPSWSAVVAVLIKAGRGLAAAHAAGLIHRDFKPANLLVGDDGRVVVTDFGLARAAIASSADDRAGPHDGLDTARGSVLASSLTRSGAVQGTPAYMAPEQQRGELADARADQFSFCVTLFETVFRVHPFRLGEPDVRIPDDTRGVPSWLQRIVLRGLRTRPDDRYPSMDGLLAALQREPERRRRRSALAGLAVLAVAVAVGALVVTQRPAVAPCGGAEQQLAEIWNPSAQAEMRSAFAATGLAYAPATWDRVAVQLDGYARRWVAMHTDACQATQVRGEQSALVMDRRMACLDLRRRELAELALLLHRPDRDLVGHAVDAARGLSTIESCGDLAALNLPIAPPPDRAAELAVSAARRVLADARVLTDAGKFADGLALVGKLADQAVARDYLPVRAEVAYATARLDMGRGQWERARGELDSALWAAEASGYDDLATRTLSSAVRVASELDHFVEGHALASRGEAALLRFRAPPDTRVYFRAQLCALLAKEARPDEALPACQAALELARREVGPDHRHVVTALSVLALLANRRGDYERSLGYAREAMAIQERTLGPDHPDLADTISNAGYCAYLLGHLDEALDLYQRSLRITQRAIGPDAVAQVNTLDHLGNLYKRRERYADAIATFERAIAIVDKAHGPQHSLAASPHTNLANVLEIQHDYAGAIEHHRRAAAILEATVGTGDPTYGIAILNICSVEHRRGRDRDALAACTRGMPVLEHALGPKHPLIAQALVETVCVVEAASGHVAEGFAALERGIAIWRAKDPDRETAIAAGEIAFAQRVWTVSPPARQRARALAIRARDRYRKASPAHEADRAAADAWLARH